MAALRHSDLNLLAVQQERDTNLETCSHNASSTGAAASAAEAARLQRDRAAFPAVLRPGLAGIVGGRHGSPVLGFRHTQGRHISMLLVTARPFMPCHKFWLGSWQLGLLLRPYSRSPAHASFRRQNRTPACAHSHLQGRNIMFGAPMGVSESGVLTETLWPGKYRGSISGFSDETDAPAAVQQPWARARLSAWFRRQVGSALPCEPVAQTDQSASA